MARGPKKHMKRVASPYHWMLDKLTGVYAPRPSTGPHKLRECVPLVILLRNRLRYALTYNEAKMICMQRLIKVDGKIRTDMSYPAGFMDIITIDKIKGNFCLLWDTKGRFKPVRIPPEEAKKKLCRVNRIDVGPQGVLCARTHDGRTLRFIHPEVKANDTVVLDIAQNKITKFVKFDVGNVCMVTGGHNIGRVGTIIQREPHPGSHEIIHLKDAKGHVFVTRVENVFCIGEGNTPLVRLPKDNGVRLNILEEREKRLRQLNN